MSSDVVVFQESLQEAFRVFDLDNDGLIDGLETLVAMALVSKMDLEAVRCDACLEITTCTL